MKSFIPIFNDFSLKKEYFPYHLISTKQELSKLPLPSYEDFTDRFLNKGKNPLDEDHEEFQKLLQDGMSEEEALKALKITQVPPTGRELHAKLTAEWKKKKYSSLLPILESYAMADVKTLIPCIEYERERFFGLGVLPFYHHSSLPGLAFTYFINSTEHKFVCPTLSFQKDLQVSTVT